MELEALKKLTRSELQKLAKSMGVRAVGKTADIIQRLCDTSKAQAARGNNANYVDETERVRKTNTSASATAVNAPWDGNSEAASEPVSENHEENERMIPAAGKSRPVDTSPHAMPKRLRQTVQLNSRRTNTASPAVRAQSGQEASEQSDGGTEGERASHPATNRSVRPAIMRFGDFMENGAASQGEVTCDGQHDIAAGGSVSKPVSPSASEVRPEAAERLPASVTRPGEHFPPDVQGTGQAHTAPRSRTSSPITNREAIPPTFSKFRGNRVARTDTARREHSEIVAGPSGNHRGPSTSSPHTWQQRSSWQHL
ncbi:hypothetical protein C8Q74DRAFT_926410 [Fomes fomentarius]|nr:hypothetical protein C8Q74DRAFT_926410 [Fomes fomentarius]